MVSCINALRYGGTEEHILNRLYENGMADLCDNVPEGKYFILVRDRVSFYCIDHFSFVKRWTGGGSGIIYDCTRKNDDGYILQISADKSRPFEWLSGEAALLHDFLKLDSRITNIKWSARDMPGDVFYDKPY
jgi:hypothetical protein